MNDRIAYRTGDLTRIGINAREHSAFCRQLVFVLIPDLGSLHFCTPISLLV
jgi:hypothetical protein